MVTLSIYLDCRRRKNDGTFPLKLSVCLNSKTKLLSLGISLKIDQWDVRNCCVSPRHPNCRILNNCIASYRLAAEKAILELDLADSRNLGIEDYMTAIKFAVTGQDTKPKRIHTFAEQLQVFSTSGGKKESTRDLYLFTLSRMRAFDPEIDNKTFEEINLEWLEGFESFCAKTASKNARNIHLRNIRAVFNNAIDYEITTAYPFRRFKIRDEETEHRAMSLKELRELFNCPVEPYAELYRDMFKLIFMLIGINSVDLHGLKSVEDGRIKYKRAKTYRLYSIKVEPEAMEIIEKYRGEKGLLCIADRWSDSRNFRHQCNKALQRIGTVERKGRGGKKIIKTAFSNITTYWARHTWSTIAAELDIPDATIGMALGHASSLKVTERYIKRNERKIDEANRRVLDWVLYGKR